MCLREQLLRQGSSWGLGDGQEGFFGVMSMFQNRLRELTQLGNLIKTTEPYKWVN